MKSLGKYRASDSGNGKKWVLLSRQMARPVVVLGTSVASAGDVDKVRIAVHDCCLLLYVQTWQPGVVAQMLRHDSVVLTGVSPC